MHVCEIKPKSEEIVHFYLTFLKFSMCFVMKTAMFWFDQFHFLLVVQDILKFHEFVLFGRQYQSPISPDIEIFLCAISISTQPNDLPIIRKLKKICLV